MLAACSLLCWREIAAAGTTGTITGTVVNAATKAPIAGADVTVASPSQVARVTTDASGRFTFLSLAPETYTISVQHAGYATVSITGISVFADQSQTIPIALQKSLKEIARVISRSSLSPVRPGTGTDVYSVNPGMAAAAATLGGGGGLNNAYSAIAAMPGAYVPPNQVGVNQTVYIRGGYYDQIGYEYDGVPINRSFDNYPGNSETTLGQQELQIYTGGGEADANATGLAGFINQVIKTGTYPGYAVGGLAAGTPTFYHDARVEAGGSTPDRMFSYYVGISGTNQDFRYFDQFNGATLSDTIPYGYWPAHITTLLPAFYPAVYPTCLNNGTAPSSYDPEIDQLSRLFWIVSLELRTAVQRRQPRRRGKLPHRYSSPARRRPRRRAAPVHVVGNLYARLFERGRCRCVRPRPRECGIRESMARLVYLSGKHAMACFRIHAAGCVHVSGFPARTVREPDRSAARARFLPPKRAGSDSRQLSRRPLGYRQHR